MEEQIYHHSGTRRALVFEGIVDTSKSNLLVTSHFVRHPRCLVRVSLHFNL